MVGQWKVEIDSGSTTKGVELPERLPMNTTSTLTQSADRAQAAADMIWAATILEKDQAAEAISTAREMLEEALQKLDEATG